LAFPRFKAEGREVNKSVSNAAFGVLDYASYPAAMLLVAPIVLHRLGSADYGLWMIATSVVSAGGIVASGFCDAWIQQIATLRSENAIESMGSVICNLLAINISLGCTIALLVWFAAPYAALRLAVGHTLPLQECVACLRIASVAILVRAIETVPVCAQRAFEEYRGTVQISVVTRFLTLGGAAAIAMTDGNVTNIMVFTTALLATETVLQFHCLRHHLDIRNLRPDFRIGNVNLLRSGFFVWLQALSDVLFRQFDRIVLGLSLGATIVAPYSLSIQISEPLFGLTAALWSFFFPHLSGRAGTLSQRDLRRTVLKAFICNFLLVSLGAALLFFFGRRIMQAWAGTALEQGSHTILPLIVLSSALSGLSVIGTYAAQALGMFRTVACISVASRAVLLLLMLFLLQHRGLTGLALARVCYGAAALLVYWPLARRLGFLKKPLDTTTDISFVPELQKEAQL
jgi:O-antigen/teichoic acid export membrane protein